MASSLAWAIALPSPGEDSGHEQLVHEECTQVAGKLDRKRGRPIVYQIKTVL